MRYLLLIPVLLLPLPAFWLHSAACGMHVAAVHRLSNPVTRERYSGAFYRYCKFMAAPFGRS